MSFRIAKLAVVFMLISTAAMLTAWYLTKPVPVEQLISRARLAVERREASKALELCAAILEQDPSNPDALLLSAVVYAETGEFAKAIEFCRQVSVDAGKQFADSRMMAGNICLDQLGKVVQAEQHFRDILAVEPDHPAANDRMVYVLGLQSRVRELVPYHMRVLRESPAAAIRVQLLMQGELAYPDAELTQRLRKSDPSCAGLLCAEAHRAWLAKDYQTAEKFCRECVALDPALAEAQGKLGTVLLQMGRQEELAEWLSALPDSVQSDSDVLYVAGRIAFMQERIEEAARCFWESLVADPNHVAANYYLGRTLTRLDRSADATVFLDRATRLERYQKQLESASPNSLSDADDPAEFERFLIRAKETMEMAQTLGLVWETYSWVVIAAQAPRPPEWSREMLRTLQRQINTYPLTRTPVEQNPAAKIDLSSFPKPRFSAEQIVSSEPFSKHSAPESQPVTFEEIGADHGLDFLFHNGFPKPRDVQRRAYDFTGGGVAVIDFDADGWPDLCFAQGCSLTGDSINHVRQPELLPAHEIPRDHGIPDDDASQNEGLFRNLQGRMFRGVSALAVPFVIDYSQGLAVGDYDSDGLPDLLIANLGRNRLLRNNGDGTFSDDQVALQNDSEVWTTSALFCDLNNDSHPDLYFVNYLSGEILSRICSDENGRYGHCAPQSFPAEQDQLLLNQGDGTFRDVTEESGIRVSNGKGLGIVAADFNRDQRLDLFVANDGVPNFLFINQTPVGSQTVRLTEQAMACGVAVNGSGQSEACMGIAAEDLDRDGRIDLFVTNFYGETNTVYRQVSDDPIFEDVTPQAVAGLAGLRTLGFGTQAIDSELDGWPDLVVLNGHVDSYPDQNIPYRMLPQYFANKGKWQFREVPGEAVSPWFGRPQLGRSAARVDWNRDGAEDLAVTLLDEPSSVLTSTTADRGHFLALQLISVNSDRSATGSRVTVNTDAMPIVRTVNAGDGYQCSNEKTLIFGLGQKGAAEQISVQWPGGTVQKFASTEPNRMYLVIEGRPDLYLLPW